VIFATVGSHPTFAFDRFLRGLEALPGDELVVQYGPGSPPANASHAVAWMSFADVLDNMVRAEKVVGHAGTGTIFCAMRAGHTPVVVPRLQRLGETVDDHQLDLARAMAATGDLILVEDVAGIAEAVESAPPRGEARSSRSDALAAAVRSELLGGS
jgi:UDP-N-acetylglucosamine transferase subunit ALG13